MKTMENNNSFKDEAYNFTSFREEFSNTSLNATFVSKIVKDHLLKEEDNSVHFGLILLYIPTFLMGLLGNIFLATIIVRRKSLQNATNICLCNLAFADLSGKSYTFNCKVVPTFYTRIHRHLFGKCMFKNFMNFYCKSFTLNIA
jgi:hypothetical protein